MQVELNTKKKEIYKKICIINMYIMYIINMYYAYRIYIIKTKWLQNAFTQKIKKKCYFYYQSYQQYINKHV